jgi:ubiquinone/menaquinone biosynthesis C-methylase UbiE
MTIFDLFARPYHLLTSHQVWRDQAALLASFLPPASSRPSQILDILDLGTGPGYVALELSRPGHRVVGLDLSRGMLRQAASERDRHDGVTGRVSLVQGDAQALPFADGSFDGVTAQSVIYLVPDRERLLHEVVRVLRPRGRVAFVEPRQGGALLPVVLSSLLSPRFALSMIGWRLASRVSGRFREQEIAAMLERAGLTDVAVETTLGGLGMIAAGSRP